MLAGPGTPAQTRSASRVEPASSSSKRTTAKAVLGSSPDERRGSSVESRSSLSGSKRWPASRLGSSRPAGNQVPPPEEGRIGPQRLGPVPGKPGRPRELRGSRAPGRPGAKPHPRTRGRAPPKQRRSLVRTNGILIRGVGAYACRSRPRLILRRIEHFSFVQSRSLPIDSCSTRRSRREQSSHSRWMNGASKPERAAGKPALRSSSVDAVAAAPEGGIAGVRGARLRSPEVPVPSTIGSKAAPRCTGPCRQAGVAPGIRGRGRRILPEEVVPAPVVPGPGPRRYRRRRLRGRRIVVGRGPRPASRLRPGRS